jgi:hypothetical protein
VVSGSFSSQLITAKLTLVKQPIRQPPYYWMIKKQRFYNSLHKVDPQVKTVENEKFFIFFKSC